MTMRDSIRALDALHGGRTLVFASSRLDIDLLPTLYEALRPLGRVEHLRIILQCRGGETNAARRIALLFHELAGRVEFVVPHFCESAGTVMALAAHRIVAGPLAIFSPIDPHLSAQTGGNGPSAMSAQDIRQFWRMGRDWFGLDESDAKAHALQTLSQSIFPSTLTSFHRCALEVEAMGEELLSLHMADGSRETRARIVDTLLYGYHSHTHAITRDELRRLGLPVESDPALEADAWDIVRALRAHVGPETRSEDDAAPWFDAAVITADTALRRARAFDAPVARWQAFEPGM